MEMIRNIFLRLQIILILGFISTAIFSQDGGVYALQETLEETKKDIGILEEKLSFHGYYSNYLTNSAKNVSDFKADSIKNWLQFLNDNISKSKPEVLAPVLSNITTELTKLAFPYSQKYKSADNLDTYEEQVTGQFIKNMAEKLRPIIGYTHYERWEFLFEGTLEEIKKAVEVLTSFQQRTPFSSLKVDLLTATETEIRNNNQRKNEVETQLNKKRLDKASIITQMTSKDKEVNALSIKLGLPLFCGTVLMLFIGAYLYKKLVSRSTQSGAAEGEISKVLLEVITVLLITMSVLILGLAKILTENVLGTLLGGIAGYILNRTKSTATT